MLQVLLLLTTGALAACSILTFVRARSVFTWKLALLATEYGHLLAVVAALFGVVTLVSWSSSPAGPAAWFGFGPPLLLSMFAAVSFLRPVANAYRIAGALRNQLCATFHAARPDRPPLLLRQLLLPPWPHRYSMQTYVFAHAGTTDELRLDFYPARSSGPTPCIIVIHGGGWDAGERTQFRGWNADLARAGYAVAAITYRLAPRHQWPAQQHDTLAAIAWLKAQASALRIDPARLVLFGRSAGGQIATAVGYGSADPAIRGIIALYAPHDLPFVWSIAREDDVLNSVKLLRQYLGGPPDPERRAAYTSASGQLVLQSPSPHPPPPTLLLHGTLDELVWVHHSRRLADQLALRRVPHVFLELPWATHAFDFNPRGPGGQITAYALECFLSAITASGNPSQTGGRTAGLETVH